MNLQEIEQNVADLDLSKGFDFVYDLLRAYGIPKASISRLKSGSYDRSKSEDEHLWKGKLYYRFVDDDKDLHALIDDAKNDDRIMRDRPRFLIVRDRLRLLAIDSKVETTLDIAASDLPAHTAFFLPWAGIEKTQLESLNYADIKAAEKMARLYDEIVKHNEISTPDDIHDLNVFFSRLLFCFFAEDTGVFPKGCFTNAIGSLTKESGEETGPFLDELFEVLDTPPQDRHDLAAHFSEFGYVNGKLFARRSSAPRFSSKARRVLLESGTLNWSQINPDIFGSMIQAVVHPSHREGLGMHYTSVENIMKVIRPLFLDELDGALEQAADSAPKLERLLDRIASIKVFDPACGSGNFLVIAYKELRRLEHRILQRLAELQRLDSSKSGMFKLSKIKLENFYGIEIDDFAHEIAILSLWLAKHQMNVEFKELFGVEISLIPLRDTGNIVCANAARVDWEAVCPADGDGEIYLPSNPPYLGARLQSSQQKADLHELADTFGEVSNNLDYVAIWFLLGARYVAEHDAALGFVSTNSVCQGDQVGLLWPSIYEQGVDIAFGVQSFLWTNRARGSAGVTCVIIGLRGGLGKKRRTLYSGDLRYEVDSISPYLTANHQVIVKRESDPISPRPPMTFGSMPNDGGHLILSRSERDELVSSHSDAEKFIRRNLGSREFIRGLERYVLWIADEDVEQASAIPGIAARLERVATYRNSSERSATRRLSSVPHRFGEVRHRETASIIIPRHSSQHREYVPLGFLDHSIIISDAANAIYDAEPWIFGLVQSKMHIVWVKAVGGRIKTDIRYSADLCYNTFPFPDLNQVAKASLEKHALGVLEAREQFSDKTLAELYDPEKMPAGLRAAHRRLDEAVDDLYGRRGFNSNEERLGFLFERYEEIRGSKNKVPLRA